jgi:hypothetical protein
MNLGDPDYAFEQDEVHLTVGRMWGHAKPGVLLINTWNQIICNGRTEYRFETQLTRLTSNNDRAALVRDRKFLEWLKPRLEWHPGFVELKRLLGAIGVEGRYTGFGEYVGQAELYGFRLREEHIPPLEALAQEESGFTTAESRARAAEDFRIYMRRHYDKDWEANRKILPPIDVSPYALPPFNEGHYLRGENK